MPYEKKQYYKISQLSQITNISPSKIRYYDKNGILNPCYIDENKYRYYDVNSLDTIAEIKAFQRRGATLEEIRSLLYNRQEFFSNFTGFAQKRIHNLEKQYAAIEKQLYEFRMIIEKFSMIEKDYAASSITFNPSMTFAVFNTPYMIKPEDFTGPGSEQKFFYLERLFHDLVDVKWFAYDAGFCFPIDSEGNLNVNQAVIAFKHGLSDLPLGDATTSFINTPCLRFVGELSLDECQRKTKEMLGFLHQKLPKYCHMDIIYTWELFVSRNEEKNIFEIAIPLRRTV